jgi:hypothetical protein
MMESIIAGCQRRFSSVPRVLFAQQWPAKNSSGRQGAGKLPQIAGFAIFDTPVQLNTCRTSTY